MPRVATTLTRTAKGGWLARKRIPEDVREAFGQRWEERFRRGPMPVTLAITQHREWLNEIEVRIANIRAARDGRERMLTLNEARKLAATWYHWFVQKHHARESEAYSVYWKYAASEFYDEFQNRVWEKSGEKEYLELDPLEVWAEDDEARAGVRPLVADRAEIAQFLDANGLVLDRASQDLFLDYVCRDLLEAMRLLQRRAKGDDSPDRYAERFPKLDRVATDPGLTPWLLFDRWVNEAKPERSTVERWHCVFVKMQADFPEATALTPEQAQVWANGLINSKRSAGTVRNGWVTAAHTVFEWARRQKLVAHNPFNEVHIKVPRKVRNRETKAFTEDEIRAILSAALAIGQPKTKTEAVRRWVPWLLAYTGARVGELTQLRGTDVEQSGIAAIKVLPEAGTVKTKTARTVPIHEHLIEQGFLEFVRANGKGALFYDAPTGPAQKEDPTKPRRPGAVKARERLAAWVRELGVTDREIAPNHGWRHTFKQISSRHGIKDTTINWIVGHTQASEGAKYGEPTLRDKADALKAFPRYAV
jgi:integrase